MAGAVAAASRRHSTATKSVKRYRSLRVWRGFLWRTSTFTTAQTKRQCRACAAGGRITQLAKFISDFFNWLTSLTADLFTHNSYVLLIVQNTSADRNARVLPQGNLLNIYAFPDRARVSRPPFLGARMGTAEAVVEVQALGGAPVELGSG